MNEIKLTTKELALIKMQTTKALTAANELEIKKPEDMNAAIDLVKKIKEVGKLITEKKESITKPINEALKNARSLFTPFEKQYADAELIVKEKMLYYHQTEAIKAAKAEAKIEQKVEEGKMTFKEAETKIAAVQPQTTIEAKTAEAQFRIHREAEIYDEALLPREYLIPDRVRINRDALAGKEIAGVKVIEKKIVAIR